MSEPTTHSIQNLLSSVSIIKNKYDDIAKITGENFNIFSVFNKTYHENYHSALISELLNERGSHEQGRLYLDLFIPIINKIINDKNSGISEISNFVNSTSVTEKVTDMNDRIDIYIESDNQIILIENKIGANDQPNQLERYFNYVSKNKNGKTFVFLYLWKDYIDVDTYLDNNTFGEGDEVRKKTISISYKTEIKTWIEQCIKASASLPLIRETLIQYLHTVNTITNQSTNNKMSKEIIKTLINDKNHLISSLYLINNKNNIYDALIDKVSENIEKINKTNSNYTFKTNKYNQEIEFRFYFENFDISLDVSIKDDGFTAFGVIEKDNKKLDEIQKKEINLKLMDCNFGKKENWSNWVWISRYLNWSDSIWEKRIENDFAIQLIKDVEAIYNLIK